MQPIRNRYFGGEAKRLLPWGDPYILQLFGLLERLENQSEASTAAGYSAQYLRVPGKVVPAGNRSHPPFDR
jgi:hypothetical protein